MPLIWSASIPPTNHPPSPLFVFAPGKKVLPFLWKDHQKVGTQNLVPAVVSCKSRKVSSKNIEVSHSYDISYSFVPLKICTMDVTLKSNPGKRGIIRCSNPGTRLTQIHLLVLQHQSISKPNESSFKAMQERRRRISWAAIWWNQETKGIERSLRRGSWREKSAK